MLRNTGHLLAPALLAPVLALSALLGACEQAPPPDPEPPPFDPATCKLALHPGASPVRRMTRFEYDATVRDLLGDDTSPASGFGAEEEALGFNNNAAALTTSALLAEKYLAAAEGISDRATTPLEKNVPCDPAALGEDACALAFIEDFGKRAFRRPLEPSDADELFALYKVGRAAEDFRMGIRMVIEAALQSPEFLYRVELGAEAVGTDAVRLSAWEMASRLSFFLWGSMPDDELFAAAEAGELSTPEQIRAQAERMLDDPKARLAIAEFHAQWLDVDRVLSAGKDATLFPEWSSAVAAAMREEARAFFPATVLDGAGTFEELYTANWGFANATLANLYGVPGPTGDALEEVTFPAGQRSGILTLGALLATNAHSNLSSPVHRGKFVREQLLCQPLDPPPPNVVIKPPSPDPNATLREQLKQHQTDPSCSGCHSKMDPIGFGFESYDALGRYRDMENGEPVDASGKISGTDAQGTFVGVPGLAAKLIASQDAQECYATQYFRWAYGRGEGDDDACNLYSIDHAFEAAGHDVRSLLVALTQTDAFLYRRKDASPSAANGNPGGAP